MLFERLIKYKFLALLLLGCSVLANAAPNLLVSGFTYTTPQLNGATVNFTVVAQNSGDSDATNVRLRVFLPSNVTFSTLPTSTPAGSCSFSNPAYTFSTPSSPDPGSPYNTLKLLTCTYSGLAAGSSISLPLVGTASSQGVSEMQADVYSDFAESGGDELNNALPKQITVNAGADLAFQTTPLVITKGGVQIVPPDNPTILNGSTVVVVPKVKNAGPDAVTSARVVVVLPPTANFGSVSYPTSGNWVCSNASNTITCNYGGASVASGANFPDISITGTFTASNVGTMSFSASIVSPGNTDPDTSNNGPYTASITLQGATDLTATKALRWNNTNVTQIAYGNAAVFRLGIHNAGPMNVAAAGAKVVDTFPSDWTLGAMPTGCSAVGQTVTCTTSSILTSGSTVTFDIPVTSPATGSSGSNVAQVTLTDVSLTETDTSNNTATVNYTLVAGAADLTISKGKSSATGTVPVADGGAIYSDITVSVTSGSTAYATGTISVTDTLASTMEVFDAAATATANASSGWTCTATSATLITCTHAGGYAPGTSLPTLRIVTKADISSLAPGAYAALSNTACTGSTADAAYTLDNAVGNDCSGAKTINASKGNANVAITKTVTTTSGNTNLENSETAATYTLTVTNNSGDAIPVLTVTDPITGYMAFPGTVGTTGVVATPQAGDTCSLASGVETCTLNNVAVGETRTITVVVSRPLNRGSGTLVNTASLSSNTTFLTGTLSASATLTVDPETDVRVSKSANPTAVRTGQVVQFSVVINVDGPDNANQLKIYDAFDSSRFTLDTSSFKLNGSATALCSQVAVTGAWSGNSTVDTVAIADGKGIYCNLGDITVSPGTSTALTLLYNATPKFPYPDSLPATYTNHVYATTDTYEAAASLANNYAFKSVTVNPPALDLTVSEDDTGFDPQAWDTTGSNGLTYHIFVTNSASSQSQASAVKAVSLPIPPAGYFMTMNGSSLDTSGSYYSATGFSCSQAGGGPNTAVTCSFDNLPVGKTAAIALSYSLFGPTPTSAKVFENQVYVCSSEAGPSGGANCAYATATNYDTLPANNYVTEKTTVLPKTDLHTISKTASKTNPDLNEVFNWTITFSNKGPADAPRVLLTDTLPAGMVIAGAVTVTPPSNTSILGGFSHTCGSIAVGAGSASSATAVTCTLDNVIADPAESAANQVVITVPVKVDSTLTPPPSASSYTNTACVTPAIDSSTGTAYSKDPDASNNCASGSITVQQKASLSGKVYYSAALAPNATVQTGGISGVTLTATGTAGLANGVTRTATTDSSGNYSFDQLPPGTYTLSETQPSAYYDGRTFTPASITNGDVSGIVSKSASTYIASAAADTVTGIVLNDNGAGTNFNFEEYKPVTIAGYVYEDKNNNGVKETGEGGLSGAVLSLSGTDYRGLAVSVSTITTPSSGFYQFSAPPTGTSNNYTVTEVTEPASTYDGQDYDGAAVIAGSAHLSGTDTITVTGSVLTPGAALTSRNFGELKGGSISGYAYLDINNNALKDSGETVISGITVTLTGTDYLGNAVSQSMVTSLNTNGGRYDFTNLKPGTYTVTETAVAALSNTGAQAGVPVSGTATGASTSPQAVSGIPLTSSSALVNYNFGHKGTLISGRVYLDTNRNGISDTYTYTDGSGSHTVSEPGLSGVAVTISGHAWNGQDVCTLITCTTTTASDGSYQFVGLPASDVSGYTLKEKDGSNNPSPILSLYGDGAEQVGALGGDGTSVNDQISGIVLAIAQSGTNYNFGELAGRLAGTVYFDTNNSGTQDSGESGIANISLTLSGSTPTVGVLSSAPVCSFMISGVCTASAYTVTTDSNGNYVFENLPAVNASGYVITETHPTQYLDGKETAGTLGGTAPNTGFDATSANNNISAIALAAGAQGSAYLFGERGSSLSGYVYIDANDDGSKGASEPGIQSVTVTLSGNTSTGANVCSTVASCTVTTDANGYFFFGLLPASDGTGYTLTETHPSGYLDGKETAGTISAASVGTVDNAAYDTSATHNRITNIVMPVGATGSNYLFGERGGTLSGYVYADGNNDGSKGAGEPGISGVTVTLSGTISGGGSVCSVIPSCVATTDAAGAFSFIVPPGTYTLVETQSTVPVTYTDGKETAGVAGGTVDNSAVGSQVIYNTIDNINVTAGVINTYAGQITGYLFGEVPKVVGFIPPRISGYVWMDRKHDRNRPTDGTAEGQTGWTVVLQQSGTTICTVTTDSAGYYVFDNLHCPAYLNTGLPVGSGYSVQFTKDSNRMSNVTTSAGNVGTTGVGQITNITLISTSDLVEQNLPLDPAGIVYDAVTRLPVPGAVVTITGPAGFNPATQLLGGSDTQTTGSDGLYSFLLQNAYPSGTYTLTVTAPSGYLPAPSVMIPPCGNGTTYTTLTVTSSPNPTLVQGNNAQPGLSQTLHTPASCPASNAGWTAVSPFTAAQTTTQYYYSFNITNGVSSPILNNHIPIDPILPGTAIVVTKVTPLLNVAKGDLVPYTITATNNSGGALANIDVTDQIPPGFRYRTGSATYNGVSVEPTVSGRVLTWKNVSFAKGEKKTYKMILVVGAGVSEGSYVNQAWTRNNVVNVVNSNVATATVRVVPDPNFDCSDIIGKVFDDKNANGYQDDGEPGIANVRIATPRGLLVTTDSEGRFHVTCADIPQQDRGSNFVMKLDERTLPSGYRVTTENPRDVRTTRGKMVKLNFGATIHRVVRLEVADDAFVANGTELNPAWAKQMSLIPAQLKGRPSVLRIAYLLGKGDPALARKRLDALAEQVRALWKKDEETDGQKEKRNPLVIETELEGVK